MAVRAVSEVGAASDQTNYAKGRLMAPSITATLDKASYSPGELATLTVVYSDGDAAGTNTITIRGVDLQGNQALVTVQLAVVDKISLTVTDDSGRVWTLQSDDGHTAVYTATI